MTRILAMLTVLMALPAGAATVRCTDGDAACDADGIVNGACVVDGMTVALRTVVQGIRPGVLRQAGRRFVCRPSTTAPAFSAVVQPILVERCATTACHTSTPPNAEPVLEAGRIYDGLVHAGSLNVPAMVRVEPRRPARSYLVRKILGRRIPDRTARMPSGCPDAPPSGGCLTPAETAAIVAWIAGGAPRD